MQYLIKNSENSVEKNPNFNCDNCDNPEDGGGIGGWSVHTWLWNKFGNGKGILCIPCFEKRLVRKLTHKDFSGTMDNHTNKNVQRIFLNVGKEVRYQTTIIHITDSGIKIEHEWNKKQKTLAL